MKRALFVLVGCGFHGVEPLQEAVLHALGFVAGHGIQRNSVDAAENIVVIKTVSGMAGAVAAAVDAMRMQEIVGSLAGDDTILCVIRTSDDAVHIMKKLRKIVEQ